MVCTYLVGSDFHSLLYCIAAARCLASYPCIFNSCIRWAMFDTSEPPPILIGMVPPPILIGRVFYEGFGGSGGPMLSTRTGPSLKTCMCMESGPFGHP